MFEGDGLMAIVLLTSITRVSYPESILLGCTVMPFDKAREELILCYFGLAFFKQLRRYGARHESSFESMIYKFFCAFSPAGFDP